MKENKYQYAQMYRDRRGRVLDDLEFKITNSNISQVYQNEAITNMPKGDPTDVFVTTNPKGKVSINKKQNPASQNSPVEEAAPIIPTLRHNQHFIPSAGKIPRTLLPECYLSINVESSDVKYYVMREKTLIETFRYTDGSLLDNSNRCTSQNFNWKKLVNIQFILDKYPMIEQVFCFIESFKDSTTTDLAEVQKTLSRDEIMLYAPLAQTGKKPKYNTNLQVYAYSICDKDFVHKLEQRGFNVTTKYIATLDFLQHYPNTAILDCQYDKFTLGLISQSGIINYISEVKHTAKAYIELQRMQQDMAKRSMTDIAEDVKGFKNLGPDVKESISESLKNIKGNIPSFISRVLIYEEFIALPWNTVLEQEIYYMDICLIPCQTLIYDKKEKESLPPYLIPLITAAVVLTTIIIAITSVITQKKALVQQEQIKLEAKNNIETQDKLVAIVQKCIEKTDTPVVKASRVLGENDFVKVYFSLDENLSDFKDALKAYGVECRTDSNAEHNQILIIYLPESSQNENK